MDQNITLINDLRDGQVAVILTGTLYGIVASAANPEAVSRIYALRKRKPSKLCII